MQKKKSVNSKIGYLKVANKKKKMKKRRKHMCLIMHHEMNKYMHFRIFRKKRENKKMIT